MNCFFKKLYATKKLPFVHLKTTTRPVPCPQSEGQFSVYSLICLTCDWPTHLVISQSDQDDVWRVNPNLEENKTEQRLPRVTQQHTALCDPHTHTQGQSSPRCHINGGWLTIENTPTQHYVRGVSRVCWWGGKGARGAVRTFLPFSGVFLWCGKAAWFHQSTWPPDVHSPAF